MNNIEYVSIRIIKTEFNCLQRPPWFSIGGMKLPNFQIGHPVNPPLLCIYIIKSV